MLFLCWEKKLDSGYYAACAGLQAQTQALEVIANNLANLNTTGYRGQQPLFRSLLASSSGEFSDPLNRAINNFGTLSGSLTDLAAGNLERTGNSLDLAIEGNAFFAVQSSGGILYTRDGNFQVSHDGHLTTATGDSVLGDQGPVLLPSGEISISPDRTISAGGAVAGKLRLIEFLPQSNPQAVGNSEYSAPQTATRMATNSYVRQGMLEASNVNPVMAVVDLLMVQRRAEMLERAMSSFNANLDHIAAGELPKV